MDETSLTTGRSEDEGSSDPIEFTSLVAPSDTRWLWFIPLLAVVGFSMWYFWPRSESSIEKPTSSLPALREVPQSPSSR
jgi:hypothetical protein